MLVAFIITFLQEILPKEEQTTLLISVGYSKLKINKQNEMKCITEVMTNEKNEKYW